MTFGIRNNELFERTYLAARAVWPDLIITAEIFARHIEDRLLPNSNVTEAIQALHVSDLYLACTCVHGVEGAVDCFERRYAMTITKALKKIRGIEMHVEDAHQIIRHKLLVADDDAPPKLAAYSGRGSLESWVAIVSRRVALNWARGHRAHDDVDDYSLASALPAGANPELDYLRTRYREEFRKAFELACKTLTPRERILLRMHIVNGLTHDQIAPSYRVDPSTLSRWLAKARATLWAEVERHFRERLNVDESDFYSIVDLVRSHLDVSLARWLGENTA